MTKTCSVDVLHLQRSFLRLLGLLICLTFLFGTGSAVAAKGGARVFPPGPLLPPPPVPPQFDITGFIQEASLDTAGTICKAADPRLAGGTLKVNNISVIVPCNTILQMPASTLTWQELFSLAPRDIGLPLDRNGIPTQTGLALKDTVSMPLTKTYSSGPLSSYEVHVQGNVVKDQYIAGLIFISQQNLNLGQGIITAIDYANGELQITTTGPTATTARVKINDPLGRFGLSHGAPGSNAALIEPNYDRRFSIDEESPTIHSATGYPMCIPRSDPFNDVDDPLCPQANRPRSPDCASLPPPFPAFTLPPPGQFCTTFMMPPPPRSSCTASAYFSCPPDSTQQAPFEVGDFIDFFGTLKVDSRGPYISAHTIVARVGIYTTPGIMPAYVSIEMELQGTSALPAANLPQETTSRIKVEGFSTDPTNLVDIYALDVDPQTGTISERLLGIANPGLPPVIGRFRFLPAAGAFLPPVREFRAVSRTLCGDPSLPCQMPAAQQTYANGLIAGQYHAPNFEFIFPENIILGDRVVPANLQDFVFLFCGSGPLATPTAGGNRPVVGQLDPPPWAPPMMEPAFASALCPEARKINGTISAAGPFAPVANAIATPASVASNQTVNLSALTSSDPNTPPRILTYTWTQTGGPAVTLNGAQSATPNFTAPVVTAATTLSFNVAVSNSISLTSDASVSVLVNPPAAPPGANFSAPFNALAGSSVTLIGLVTSGSTFTWTQTSGPLVTLTGADTLSPSFVAPSGLASLTFVLTATNAAGASATATRVISVYTDDIRIGLVTWDNQQGKGKLNITAFSSIISTTSPTVPAGMTMTATFWNDLLPAGLTGSATNPISVPMTLYQDPLVCETAQPCFNVNLSGVITDPASPPSTPVFITPSTVMVKSSIGGIGTATRTTIRIR